MLHVLFVTLALVGLLAHPGEAQVADHLKCYKVKDPQAKATYTADLGGLVAEPGCTIKVPAIMACVPATKTNVMPTPPGTGGTGTPNAFGCYKVKCPKATLPALELNDQFGSRSVTPSTPKLLCAPAAAPTTSTTTTTTTNCPTTTAPLLCVGTFNAPCSVRPCPPGQTCGDAGGGACQCVGPPAPCGTVNASMCGLGVCPTGMQCVSLYVPPACTNGCECR